MFLNFYFLNSRALRTGPFPAVRDGHQTQTQKTPGGLLYIQEIIIIVLIVFNFLWIF